IIVEAEAFGTGQEYDLLIPVLESGREKLSQTGLRHDLSGVVVLADNGYYKETNLKFLAEHNIEGYIPDTQYRKRDPVFQNMHQYRDRLTDNVLYQAYRRKHHFEISDFKYDAAKDEYLCPNDRVLSRWGKPTIVAVPGHE